MAAPTFGQGIEQFNQQQFYACHDTLEALWMEAPDSERNFYQGFLQVAVGCYHLGNHNWTGAVLLLGEGIRRLIPYQPTYGGVNVAEAVHQSSQLLQRLQQTPPEALGEFVRQMEGEGSSLGFPKIVSA